MPVINWVLQDPTDLVIQGDLLRLNAMANSVEAIQLGPVLAKQADTFASTCSPLVMDMVTTETAFGASQDYSPRHPDFTPYHCRLMSPFATTMITNNAVVATPTGALWPINAGASGILMNNFPQATTRWALTGVTRDSAGAVLASCRAVVLNVGQIAVTGTPVVGEMISDGSGNYSIEVPQNTAYQVIAYKPGSPDVAGISLNTLTPAANG